MRIKSGLLVALVGTLFLLTGCDRAAITDYAIAHVNIVDAEAGIVRPDETIVLHGNTISKVVPSKDLTSSASLKVIDGSGKFVIPGLWDMHVHFRDAKRDLKMDVANGVLGVRNMGGTITEVFGWRYAVAHGEQVGPRVVGCGPIIDGPNSCSNPQFTISVTTAVEAQQTVDSLQKQGTDCKRMSIGVIGLEETWAPATESLLERNNHAVVIGNSFRVDLLHSAESGVGCAVWNRVGASPRRQKAETPCVCARVENEFVDSMMAEVADTERRMRAKSLL